MNPERPPLYALTGIRFVAAMLVVCFHYAPVGMPSLLQNAVRMPNQKKSEQICRIDAGQNLCEFTVRPA